ncbi:unnamed protein product [Symbiodinium natans]|uniref:Pentacotripeptide-repeat region of PRORP domain-containing protein n=1 Tax=Symbiodinium natans TaxID=878477 RepID=A0A812RB76_9DINO|nr:unnamed protein product [Symbiodinium natans]
MNSSSYTSNMSVAVEGDFFSQAWTFLVSARLELTLFLAALLAHFLLFGNSTPQKTKHKSGKEAYPVAAQHFTSAKDVEAALAEAVRNNQCKQVLAAWAAMKKFNDYSISVPLASVVEAMQKCKKDGEYILRETCNYLNRKGSNNSGVVNDLLESLAKRHDSDFVERLLVALPSTGFVLDSRSYEILTNMHFTMRNFELVDLVVAQAKAAQVPLTTRTSIVLIKTALKTQNFKDALDTFRELKSLWTGPAAAGPSTAPRQIVGHLVDMACKEQKLKLFLPELATVPLSEDAIQAMVAEAVREKDEELLQQVESLAREKGIAFSESTYGLLMKGYRDCDEKVEKLFKEALEKKPDAGPELCLALLACCQQTRNFALADQAYQHFSKNMPQAVLNAFVRFHFEVENYEKVCDMYEKDAAPLREKAAAEGRAILDSRMERCVMNAALKCGRSKLAQSLLSENPSDVAKHITMIRSCAVEHNLEGAMNVFQSLKNSAAELNSVVYNTVLDACVECSRLEKAEAWMEQMKKDGMADVVSYNTLIKAHLQAGHMGKARALVEEMRVAQLQPNCITFNEIVNATVSSPDRRVRGEVWKVIHEMQAAGVKPNQVTCSILLKNLNGSSPESDINQTMQLINDMEEQLDEVLLSSVVEACVRIGKPDLLNTKLRQLMSGDIKVNGSHTFGSLIKAYGHARDMKSVWRCWKEMRTRHIKPTSITVGCMIEAVVSNGDPDGAWHLIQELGEDPHCKGILNAVIYCSVLKGFTREKNAGKVWSVYEEMQRRNIDLSVVTYNTLLDCCARCCRMDGVPDILADMKKANIKPNIITYSTMLKGHCQVGDLSAAFKLVKEMREEAGLVPDEIMYNSLLDGCAQSNLVEEGLRVLKEMEEAGVKPSNFTLSVLVKLMSRARRVDSAFELVKELSGKYHLNPNSHVYANLVQACCYSKQLQRGLKTLEEMMERKVQPDKRTYSMLFRTAVQQCQFDKVDGLLRGALGLSGALPFLSNRSLAACPGIEEVAISETLSSMASSPEGNKVAAGLLVDLRKEKPNVWVDPAVQRCVLQGGQPPQTWTQERRSSKGKGKGKGNSQRA